MNPCNSTNTRSETMSEKERAKQTNRRMWGWGTFPKDRHHTRIRKNMHGNLDVGENDELHTARVRRSSTMERRREGGREGGTEIGERKRGGRDGKDNSFHRKKNRLSHGREGPHLQGDTVRESPNANTERRLDSRVTDSTALVERMLFTVATGVTCSHQRHSVKHTERHRRSRRRRVSLESVHGGGPSRVTAEVTNAGVFCYSSDAAQCCRPSL